MRIFFSVFSARRKAGRVGSGFFDDLMRWKGSEYGERTG